MNRLLAWACVAFVFAAGLAGGGVAVARQSRTRNVYLSAIGDKGAPIAGLTAADFLVKEGGRPRDVLRAEPATARMTISLLVDDNGTGMFRYGVARFVQQIQSRAEIAISTVEPQTHKVVDYTTDTRALSLGIDRLGPRPGNPDGGQLLEGISEAARELHHREAERPIIIVLTVGGEEHSPLPAHFVLDQLNQSHAALYVISVATSALRSTTAITRPSDMLDANLNLSEVLGDGPRQSGGTRGEIVASAGITLGLQQIAVDLTHQYLVVYTLPEGVKPSDKLSVTANRPGVSLRAPARLASAK